MTPAAKTLKRKPQKLLQDLLTELEPTWNQHRNLEPIDPFSLAPGIHFDVPFEDYVRIPAVNNSSLDLLKLSPLHYRRAAPPADAPAFRFGSLVHEMKLEPHLLTSRYFCVNEPELAKAALNERTLNGRETKNVKATNEYKRRVSDEEARHPGKLRVSLDWLRDAAAILNNMLSDKVTSHLFEKGHAEVTLIWQHNGLTFKSRVDWLSLSASRILDVKTAADFFNWTPEKFGYTRQAAMYHEGYPLAYKASPRSVQRKCPSPSEVTHDNEFMFCVCEKSRPWSVATAPICREGFASGLREYHHLINLLSHCLSTNHWPGPVVGEWAVTRWHKPDDYPSAHQFKDFLPK